jgi:hypothetical protein
MRIHPHQEWLGRFARSVVVLVLIGLAPLGHVAAKSGVDELAYSQETGHFFFWDPAVVSLDDASSEPGVDYWRFSDDGVATEIWAFVDPERTPESCVRDFLDGLAADPGTQAVEALPVIGGGPPQIFGASDAFAPIVVTVDGDNGREKFAAEVSCREVVRGESLVLAWVYMPAQVFNERALDVVRVEGIDLYVYGGLHNPDGVVNWIPDGAGSGVYLRTFLPCNTTVFDVLVEAGDEGGVTVDPASLFAVDPATGEALSLTAVAWPLPQARQEPVLNLAPGETGIVHGVVTLTPLRNFDLYFADPNGDPVFLAQSILGCGQSGAAPVPIDIE